MSVAGAPLQIDLRDSRFRGAGLKNAVDPAELGTPEDFANFLDSVVLDKNGFDEHEKQRVFYQEKHLDYSYVVESIGLLKTGTGRDVAFFTMYKKIGSGSFGNVYLYRLVSGKSFITKFCMKVMDSYESGNEIRVVRRIEQMNRDAACDYENATEDAKDAHARLDSINEQVSRFGSNEKLVKLVRDETAELERATKAAELAKLRSESWSGGKMCDVITASVLISGRYKTCILMEAAGGSLSEMESILTDEESIRATLAIVEECRLVLKLYSLVHCDIKLDNFLYTKTSDSEIKVRAADLGSLYPVNCAWNRLTSTYFMPGRRKNAGEHTMVFALACALLCLCEDTHEVPSVLNSVRNGVQHWINMTDKDFVEMAGELFESGTENEYGTGDSLHRIRMHAAIAYGWCVYYPSGSRHTFEDTTLEGFRAALSTTESVNATLNRLRPL